jgi:signal transduction histidine kinase
MTKTIDADPDRDLRTISRGLSEIAHVLESVDEAPARIEQALLLAHDVIPYERCALLEATAGPTRQLFSVPAVSSEERSRLLQKMTRIFDLVADAKHIGRSDPGDRPHLAIPIIGLDKIVGVFCVEHGHDFAYDARHLRLVSVVAAQLGAYLTILRLREADVRHTEEVRAAHDFQQLLVGLVSHDLRNPLSVIMMAATQLLETADQRQTKNVERALRNARKANRIIADLMDVTHVRVTGEMSLTKQRIDLVGVARAVVDDFRVSHRANDIELGSDSEAILGEWDPDRLSQIVTNLVNNALQYGAPGSPVIVKVRCSERKSQPGDGDVWLSVHNSGPPIPGELLDVIFDPFRRGDWTAKCERSERTPRASAKCGLGLGLFIVDHIARAHDGEITVASSAELGTTFTVRLPRRAPMEAAVPSWRPNAVLR